MKYMGNLPNSAFSVGKQPCQDFNPKRDGNGNAEWDNRHCCYYCDGLVSFCETCCKDHHGNGYGICCRIQREEQK